MEELTDKQEEVLLKIKYFIKVNGYSPTIRELCDLCNLNSTATMFVHLQKLKEKGYIDYIPKKFRTIKIIKDYIRR